MIRLCTIVFALTLLSEPTFVLGSVAALEHERLFALGGINEEGRMSDGERSLRAILKQPDAAARLEAILPHASPAGQLYALLGLRRRDRAAYDRALAVLRERDARVEVARGCIYGAESFRDLVSEIDRGKYDFFLSRPPW